MNLLYYIDTGTQPFAIAEDKETLKRRCLQLFQNGRDHGYINIYVLEDKTTVAYLDWYEIQFINRNWNDIKSLKQNKIHKIGEMFFWNKKELNYVLDLIKE